jgi:hypothetical protein
MGRVAIVSNKVLAKYDRWDPGFYLEDPNLVDDVERAKKRLKYAIAGLRRARKALAENKAKVAQMKKDGEVLSP